MRIIEAEEIMQQKVMRLMAERWRLVRSYGDAATWYC